MNAIWINGQKRGSGREKRRGDKKKGVGKRSKKGIGQIMGYCHYCCVLTPGKNNYQEQGELRQQPKLLLQLV